MTRLVLFDGVDLLPDAWRPTLAPGPLRCFNPGLLRDGGGWLFAYRVVGPDQLRRVGLCRLDSRFGVVAGSAAPLSDSISFPPECGLGPRATSWFADPRLYRLEGRLFVYWNSGWHEPHNHQFLQELDTATLAPVGAPRELLLAGERQQIEKNWTIFGDGPLHVVYSIAPHRILRLSLRGEGPIALTEAAVTAWDPGDFPLRFGALRGGAVPQRVGDRYVSFCHSVYGPGHGEYRYVPAVYTFAASFPFAPAGAPVCPVPLANPFGTSTRNEKLNPAVSEVVYPCGAAYDDGRWVVSYGINDESCAIAILSPDDVDASVREVRQTVRTPATEPLPRDGRGGTGLAFCTIVARNYLGMARVCCASFLRHHPGARAFVLLADRVEGLLDPALEPFEILTAEELGIEGFPTLAFQYDVLELSTALKPSFLRYLLERRDVSRLVYLDPDVEVFSPMREIGAALEESDIVLTPHVLSPLRDDGRRPNEHDLLTAGVYNLGFLALRSSGPSLDLLHWWESRLKDGAFADPARGLFTDQKWMNLAPGHFPGVRILRHPGYNAAYWNLQERLRLEPDGDGWRINGEPLRFFHFSGFQRKDLESVSRHQDRFRLSDLGRSHRALFSGYARALDGAGFEENHRLGYAFGSFDNGARIPHFVRRLYHDLGERRELFGNPFETRREDSFFNWLLGPHRHGSPLSRLQIEMLRQRGDVAAAFPDPEGAHTVAFLQWVVEHSGPEMGLDGSWQELFREQLNAVVRARHVEEARADALRRTTAEKNLEASQAALETALAAAAATSAAAARLAILHTLSPPEDGGEPRTELKRWVEAALGRHRYRFLRRRFWDLKGRLGGGRAVPASTSDSPEPAPPLAASPAEAPSILPESGTHLIRPSPRPFGVNLFGYFDTESGLGEVARGLAAMLDAAKVPHVLVNVEQTWLRRECRPDLRFSGEHPYSVNLLAVNADQAPHVVDRFGLSRSPEQYFVGYWFWELSSFPQGSSGAFLLFDEIWAATDFCLDAFSRAGTIPVVKIPPALELPSAGRRDRSSFGFSESDFVFLYVFDFASVVTRKNPAGTIAAFRQAFGPGDPVRLVLKTTNAPRRTVQALERLAGPCRVQVWNGYLPRGELLDLVSASDAYVSLHRSEGLGLTILEAMMLGKPVASTDYSGVRDFLRGPLAFPVAHEIVPLRRNRGPYPKGSVWAEPDTSEAARQMRRIHDLRRAVPAWPEIAEHASIEARRRYGVAETTPNLARRLAIIRATIESRQGGAAGS